VAEFALPVTIREGAWPRLTPHARLPILPGTGWPSAAPSTPTVMN